MVDTLAHRMSGVFEADEKRLTLTRGLLPRFPKVGLQLGFIILQFFHLCVYRLDGLLIKVSLLYGFSVLFFYLCQLTVGIAHIADEFGFLP